MKKTVFIFLLGLMVWQYALAQKPDTTFLFVKNNGKIMANKNGADYYMIVVPSIDKGTDLKIREVQQFYLNGIHKLSGTAYLKVPFYTIDLKFVGLCCTYFPNGNFETLTYYKRGTVKDNYSYNIDHVRQFLIGCNDSTGKVLAKNGNGMWIKFNNDFTKKIEKGAVKDSLKEGEWHEMVDDTTEFVKFYQKGNIVSVAKANEEPIYYKPDKESQFPEGGVMGFNDFLSRAVRYPKIDRRNGTQGKVIVTFVVEKNGTLTNVKALYGPDESMMDAAVEAVRQSPRWLPGIKDEKQVRVQFTISFNFSLVDKYH